MKIAFPTSSINVEDVFCPFYRMLMNGAHSDADAVAINIISIASSRDWGYAIFFPSNTTRRKRELAVSRAREFYMVIRESIANARA